MKWIWVTTARGDRVLVNAAHLVLFHTKNGETILLFAGDGGTGPIKESITEIARLLGAPEPS